MRRYFTLVLILLANALSLQAQDNVDKGLIMDYLQEQQYDKIIQYMEGSIKPQYPNGLAILANAYYQSGQLALAERNYNRVLEKDSNHIQALQNLGNIARQQKQPRMTLQYFEKLVALRPDNANYYKQLSQVCDQLKLEDSAFNYIQTAYSLNPKDAGIVTSLASVLMSRKLYPRADSVLKHYYSFDSTHATVIAQLVRLSYLRDSMKTATVYGERLLNMGVVDQTTCIYMGVAYYRLRQYDNCISVYDRLMPLNGGAAPETLIYYTGLSYAEKRNYEKSNELLQTCIDLAKSKALDNYYAAIADNFEKMKKFRTAIAYYDTSYYLFRDPMRQYGIARIYDQYLQNPQKAKKYYQQYVQDAKPETKDEMSIHTYVKERIKSL